MTKATQHANFSQIRLQNKKAAVYTTVLFSGKPVMIVTEYMENGSLDTFLKVRFYINGNHWKWYLYTDCDVEGVIQSP